MEIFRGNGGKLWLCALVIVVVAVYGGWAFARPLPELIPGSNPTRLTIQTAVPRLVWPAKGQSAVGIVGSLILDSYGPQAPVPTASTAKLITALAILHDKPLAAGQAGPKLTLSANDVAIYNAYVGRGGSVVPVRAGEQISEYQALEAMLLPSADNVADSLAIWAFGSLPAYADFANSYVKQMGLGQTHVGTDASGLDPSTTSSARDLVKLGELSMQNPVISQIVGQRSASGIPVAGIVRNVNWLLGTSGIVGVKTGNSDPAGGVFVSASHISVNGKKLTIVTAVAHAADLSTAMRYSLPLIQSAQANFETVVVVKAGSIVGHYAEPWGGTLSAAAGRQLKVKSWRGDAFPADIKLNPISPQARAGQTVGSIEVPGSATTGAQSVPVILQYAPSRPSVWWRLSHPLR